MKSILDPTFRYSASYDTDLRRTFARVRGRMPPPDAKRVTQAMATVTPIVARRTTPS